jgi:hypothetical protein
MRWAARVRLLRVGRATLSSTRRKTRSNWKAPVSMERRRAEDSAALPSSEECARLECSWVQTVKWVFAEVSPHLLLVKERRSTHNTLVPRHPQKMKCAPDTSRHRSGATQRASATSPRSAPAEKVARNALRLPAICHVQPSPLPLNDATSANTGYAPSTFESGG